MWKHLTLVGVLAAILTQPVAAQPEPDVSEQFAEAINSGSVAAVRRMLDQGVSPDALVYETPCLMWAIWDDRFYVVKLLIDRGANVNLADNEGYTPLMAAAEMRNERIVELLLASGADPGAVEKTYGMSALQSACQAGDEKIVDLLLARGADWQHVDKYGGNCLEEAACNGQRAIVEKLRAKGLTTEWPLHVAAGLGDLEEVQKLLEAGAKVDQRNGGWENTPLLFAVGGGQLEVVKLLVDKGASLQVKNVIGGGPLHVAAAAGRDVVARWLIEQGCDVNAADNAGGTPLDWATDSDMAELLAEHGGEYGEVEYVDEE